MATIRVVHRDWHKPGTDWKDDPTVVANALFVGRSRELCLCYRCKKFHPGLKSIYRQVNCPLANELYDFCVRNSMVTPVLECPIFIAIKPEDVPYGSG
jgi:hypothetical protein